MQKPRLGRGGDAHAFFCKCLFLQEMLRRMMCPTHPKEMDRTEEH